MSFVRTVLGYQRLYRRLMGAKLYLLVVVMLVASLAEGVGVLMFLPLLDEIETVESNSDALIAFLGGLLGLFGVRLTFNSVLGAILIMVSAVAALAIGRERLIAVMSGELTRKLRRSLLQSYGDSDYRHYLEKDTGYLTNVVTREAELYSASFVHYAATGTSALMLMTYAVVSLLIDWQISISALIIGALVVNRMKFLIVLSRRYSIAQSEQNALFQQEVIQFVQHMKYLKATNAIVRFAPRVWGRVDAITRLFVKQSFIGGIMRSVSEPIAAILVLAILFLLVSVLERSLAGTLVLVLVYYRVMQKLLMVTGGWQKFNNTVGSIRMVNGTLDEMAAHREHRGPRSVEGFTDAIELRDVSFAFGATPVLEHVNITIRKNTSVGIVGESGAGKSTLVDLVTGLLSPDSGQVLLDGVDYTELDLPSWRSSIGYVTQENVVFNDSLRNNISSWMPLDGADGEARLREAASTAYLSDVIEASEQGFDGFVGDRGVKLSGGQRQRLAIARELFKRPELLILDEATSALDVETEEQVRERVQRLHGTVTLIVIAHRMSTIKSCDYVYVLDHGRLVEEGAYDTLMGDSASVLHRLATAGMPAGRDDGQRGSGVADGAEGT